MLSSAKRPSSVARLERAGNIRSMGNLIYDILNKDYERIMRARL